jgi:hypothetical protein
LDLNQIENYNGYLIIFGHGMKNGIIINDISYSWAELAFIIENSKVTNLILASCYGNSIKNYISKDLPITSWDGEVDAILIGLATALEVSTFLFTNDLIPKIMERIIIRASDIIQLNVSPINLSLVQWSGYTDVFKRVHSGWGATSANTLWINMNQEYGSYYLQLGYLESGHIALDVAIAQLIARAALTSAIGTMILVAITVNILLAGLSSYNRIESDYMVGVRGFLFGGIFFVYHFGDWDYRLGGLYATTVPGLPPGSVFYAGINHVSTDWTNLNLPSPSGPNLPCQPGFPC